MPFYHRKLLAPKPKGAAYPKSLNTVGDHIRARRLDLGLLQREGAAQIGVIEETLYHWERGKTAPPARFWPGIIRFLGYVPMPEPRALPEKLRYTRHVLGLTRPAFARKLGVDDSTLARWECGTTRPSRTAQAWVEKLLVRTIEGHRQSCDQDTQGASPDAMKATES